MGQTRFVRGKLQLLEPVQAELAPELEGFPARASCVSRAGSAAFTSESLPLPLVSGRKALYFPASESRKSSRATAPIVNRALPA